MQKSKCEKRKGKSMKKVIRMTAVLAGVSILLGSCRLNDSTRPEPSKSERLVMAAEATHAAYIRSLSPGQTASQEIPKAFWAREIVDLHPLRVYSHRVNIVVAQKESDSVEEGTYIVLLISSYLPTSGDDGFTFDPNPMNGNIYDLHHGVFHYTRTK